MSVGFTIYFWNNVKKFEELSGYVHNSFVDDDIWQVARKFSELKFNVWVNSKNNTLFITSNNSFSAY